MIWVCREVVVKLTMGVCGVDYQLAFETGVYMSFLQRCKAPIQRLSRLGVADMFPTHGRDFFSSARFL